MKVFGGEVGRYGKVKSRKLNKISPCRMVYIYIPFLTQSTAVRIPTFETRKENQHHDVVDADHRYTCRVHDPLASKQGSESYINCYSLIPALLLNEFIDAYLLYNNK